MCFNNQFRRFTKHELDLQIIDADRCNSTQIPSNDPLGSIRGVNLQSPQDTRWGGVAGVCVVFMTTSQRCLMELAGPQRIQTSVELDRM